MSGGPHIIANTIAFALTASFLLSCGIVQRSEEAAQSLDGGTTGMIDPTPPPPTAQHDGGATIEADI